MINSNTQTTFMKSYADYLNINLPVYTYDSLAFPVSVFPGGELPSGSLKFFPALYIINKIQQKIKNRLINKPLLASSSGNFALALATICADCNYSLTVIIDKLILPRILNKLKSLNCTLLTIEQPDITDNYINHRICKFNELSATGNYIPIDQYTNRHNMEAHYTLTAPILNRHIPDADFIFTATSTGGTICGLVDYYKEINSKTKIIAVDIEGSAIFGNKPMPRRIPGIGSGIQPPLLDKNRFDDIVIVSESECFNCVPEMPAGEKIIFGASTYAVIAAIKKYFKNCTITKKIIALSVDYGHHYIDLYQKNIQL